MHRLQLKMQSLYASSPSDSVIGCASAAAAASEEEDDEAAGKHQLQSLRCQWHNLRVLRAISRALTKGNASSSSLLFVPPLPTCACHAVPCRAVSNGGVGFIFIYMAGVYIPLPPPAPSSRGASISRKSRKLDCCHTVPNALLLHWLLCVLSANRNPIRQGGGGGGVVFVVVVVLLFTYFYYYLLIRTTKGEKEELEEEEERRKEMPDRWCLLMLADSIQFFFVVVFLYSTRDRWYKHISSTTSIGRCNWIWSVRFAQQWHYKGLGGSNQI